MALARMPAHDFPGGSNLEALGCAAMCLQLLFLVLLHNFLFNLICASSQRRCKNKTSPARPRRDASPALQLTRLFSARAERAEYSLPCAARTPLARGRRYLSSAGPSSRGPRPGAPFRGHDERSWLSLCSLRRESE